MKTRDLFEVFFPEVDFEKVEAVTKRIVTSLTQLTMEFSKWCYEHHDIFEALVEYSNNFDKIEREKIRELMKRSWFLDDELPFSILEECALLFSKGKEKEANTKLVECYEEILPEIENRLYERYPHRDKILKDIFNAYRNELYSVVIPSIFTQVDGICIDEFDGEFFLTENGVSNASKSINTEDTVWSIWALPLLTSRGNALVLCEKWRKELKKIVGEIYLNRHTVMHGEDLEYANRTNALRAFSLLGYVSSLAIGVAEEKDKRQ